MNNYDDRIAVPAGQDLTACQYKAVAIGGTIAAANTAAVGILQNKPKINEDAAVAFAGRSYYVAGAAVTAGAQLSVTTSGYMITTVASGSSPCGKALAAVASGGRGEGIFNFATAKTGVQA